MVLDIFDIYPYIKAKNGEKKKNKRKKVLDVTFIFFSEVSLRMVT